MSGQTGKCEKTTNLKGRQNMTSFNPHTSAINAYNNIQNGIRAAQTINTVLNNVNALTAARWGSFQLNNFKTISGLMRKASQDARSLSNDIVDRKHDDPLHTSTNKLITSLDASKGYIRPNRYLVEFNAPQGLRSYITQAKQINGNSGQAYNLGKIGLLCHSVSIPQKMFNTFEHKQLGVAYKVPHSIMFDPIIFTFYADGDMEVRRFFDAWTNIIINDENAAMNFYDEYIADIKISLLDVEGNIRYQVKLLEAFPMTISNIDLAYASNNSILSTSVTVSYKRWLEVKN